MKKIPRLIWRSEAPYLKKLDLSVSSLTLERGSRRQTKTWRSLIVEEAIFIDIEFTRKQPKS
jgi:hypothetical protein